MPVTEAVSEDGILQVSGICKAGFVTAGTREKDHPVLPGVLEQHPRSTNSAKA